MDTLSVAPMAPPRRDLRLGFILLGMVLLCLVLAVRFGSAGMVNLLTEFLYFLALAQLWNLLAGFAGVVSLGQHAYIGLGGYVLFICVMWFQMSPWLGIALAAAAGCLASFAIAFLVFRLKGPHLAIGTWVIAEVFRLGFSQIGDLGGNAGTSLPPAVVQALDMQSVSRDGLLYLVALALCTGIHAAAFLLLASRHGLALTAIRDNEAAARSSGVPSARVKWLVYVLVALATAAIGALIYLAKFRITPASAFDINWTSYAIFIVVIGGVGTLEGPIIGTIIFFLLREYLADLGTWYLIVLGGIAVAVMLKLPMGLWGALAARFDLHLFPLRRRLPAGRRTP
ncbi:MAG: branched-chain amino acid ABC transporter permease [Pseudomonadota bacterium]